MNNVETQLNVELTRELEELSKMEVGTDQYKVAVDGLTKLMAMGTEIEKIHVEAEDKAETRKAENEFKQKQLKHERFDQIARNVIAGVSVVGGFAMTFWGTIKSIKFEETGTITTMAGRAHIGKALSSFFKK